MEKYCFMFLVLHRYIAEMDKDGEPIYEEKEIGVYSTKKKALAAVKRFSNLPGFSSYPDGFIISRKQCYFHSQIKKNDLRVVYSPYHETYLPDEDCDFVTEGVFFESVQDVEAVIQEWKSSPKFTGHEDGFHINEHIIDQDICFWNEGFSRD